MDEKSRPLRVQALVELVSFGAINLRGYTNLDGRITFNGKSGSTYRLQVSGDYKSEENSFEVLPGEMFHRENVTVQPVEKSSARPGAPGGTISAALLNVPEKARKEYEKGMEAMRDKKLDKAREHFNKAIERYPQFDWAYNNLGVVAAQQGDVEAAKQAFARALEINKRNAAASRNLGRVYLIKEKDFSHAKEMLEQSLSAEPGSGETLTLLAYAQMQSGELDRALANAKKVHGSAPQDQFPFAHLIAARILEHNGDRNAATTEYRAYLKEAENTPEAKTAHEGLARMGQTAEK